MTYEQWEKSLLNYLKSLPADDKESVVEYYREIYGDKKDMGLSEKEIVLTFGDPLHAAARILKESGTAQEGCVVQTPKKDAKKCDSLPPVLNKTKETFKGKTRKNRTVRIIGWFFFAILILIPLISTWIGVVAVVGSFLITGGALIIGGALAIIASPLLLAFGMTFSSMCLVLGVAFCIVGIGSFLFVAFYHITKYSVFVGIKVIKYLTKAI